MASSSWSQLPGELCSSIGNRLDTVYDRFMFRLVCNSWRRSLRPFAQPPFSEPSLDFGSTANEERFGLPLQISEDERLNTEREESCGKFDVMELKKELLDGIKEYGYRNMSKAQQDALMHLYNCRDMIVLEESITEKTSIICLGILQQLDCSSDKCQALVFTTDNDSALEIGEDMREIGKHVGVKVYISNPQRSVCPTPVDAHVYVGTASVLNDDLERRKFCPDDIKMVFFDGPYDMIKASISEIFRHLLPVKGNFQIAVFSNASPENIYEVFGQWIKNHLTFKGPDELTFQGIRKHQVICVDESAKVNALEQLFCVIPSMTSVVFVKSFRMFFSLFRATEGFFAKGNRWKLLSPLKKLDKNFKDEITHELSQSDPPRVLITTAQWARGIDFQKVRLVVNYDDIFQPGNNYDGIYKSADYFAYEPDDYRRCMGLFRGVVKAVNFVTEGISSLRHMLTTQRHFGKEVVFETPGYCFPIQWVFEAPVSQEIAEGIQHFVHAVDPDEEKVNGILSDLYQLIARTKCVIFVNTPDQVQLVYQEIQYDYCCFTDVQDFLLTDNNCCALITSDVDALDIAPPRKVPLVINFDLPLSLLDYDRRIGWCGTSGVVVNFVTADDWLKAINIQRRYKCILDFISVDDADLIHLAEDLRYEELE